MNRDAALARMNGDLSLLIDMAKLYLEDTPSLLAEIKESLISGDARTVRRASHSIKSLSANFDGQRAVAAASALEELGIQQNLANCEQCYAYLVQQVAELSAALQDLILREGTP